jgi:lysozyme family protein
VADYLTSFNFLMDSEDAPRRFNIATDNNGGGVVGGINSKSFPEAFAQISALPQPLRGAAIQTFYRTTFWNRWYDALTSNEVGKRVLDMSVNAGSAAAVRLLQGAIPDADGYAVKIDGAWGPSTVAAANACDEAKLVLAYKAARCQYYKDIVEAHPANQPYLAGWIARAER